MKPVARTDRLIKQVVDQDTLVYDPAEDTACCLNSLASFVWRLCDGKHSVEDIADALSREIKLPYGVEPEDAVWEVLDELKAHHLLAAPADGSLEEASAGMHRRDVVKMLAVIPLFPAIQGITAPIAKNTASPAPTPTPSTSAPGVTQTNTQTPMVTPSISTPAPSLTPTYTPTPTPTPT